MKKLIPYLLFMFALPFYVNATNSITKNDLEKQNLWAKANSQLLFVENKGQITDLDGKPRPDILFTLKAPELTLFVGKKSLHYMFYKNENPEINVNQAKLADEKTEKPIIKTYRLDMELVGANPDAKVSIENAGSYEESYYNVPSHPEGITGVKSYKKITFKNIYENIDWVLYIKDNQVKYDFVVNPGGDIKNIQLAYDGASNTELNIDGSVTIKTPLGTITENTPVTFQEGKEVMSLFNLENSILGFEVPDYNKNEPLIIDPQLLWSTFYGGGTTGTYNTDITTDKAGNVYLIGNTRVTTGISSNGHQNSIGAEDDAFIVKFNSAGERKWATYYGGEGRDKGNGIAVDRNGNVYVTGRTTSRNGISSNGHQNTYGGILDAFIVKFNGNGVRQWGTYYGNNDNGSEGIEITVDRNDDIYITGKTFCNTGISSNGHQNAYGGSGDAFLVKFNSFGQRLWATYYGGEDYEQARGVASDNKGNVYISGETNSISGISNNGHQNNIGGNTDFFLVKFDSAGTRLWATYYGGTGNETDGDLVADDSGNVFLAGTTGSPSGISYNGHQNTRDPGFNAFLVKFDSSGKRLWGTYYGGTGNENGGGIIVDINGNIFLTGSTNSTSGISSNGFQNSLSAAFDAFIVMFNSKGKRIWATYYGGTGDETMTKIAYNKNRTIYLCGVTSSTDLPLQNAHRSVKNSDVENFIAAFTSDFCNSPDVADTLHHCSADVLKINDSLITATGHYRLPTANNCDSNLYIIFEPSQVVWRNITSGSSLKIGETYQIRTQSINHYCHQALYYSTDNGANYTLIKNNLTLADSVISWRVVDVETDNAIFRIVGTNPSKEWLSPKFKIVSPLPYKAIDFLAEYNTIKTNPANTLNAAEPGYPLRFKLQIANNRTINLLTLKGVLQSTDPYIIITDSSGTYNNIIAGKKGWSVDEYEIFIKPNVPDNHVLIFDLKVTDEIDAEDPWTSRAKIQFPVNVMEIPVIVIDDDNIPDSKGDDDDVAEKGEVIEILPLLRNKSGFTFNQPVGTLTSPDTYIDIWNNKTGATGTVYNTYKYNSAGGNHSPLQPNANNITPEEDYVFDYLADNPYSLDFRMLLDCYLTDFKVEDPNGSSLKEPKIRYGIPYGLNKGFPKPISVDITAPTDGSTHNIGSTINIRATVTSAVAVDSVKLYINGVLTHSDKNSNFRYDWATNGLSAGSYIIKVEAIDINKNKAEDIVIINLSQTSGISELNVINKNYLYPNPGNGNFTLKFGNYKEAATGYIFDLSGKELYQFKVDQNEVNINANFLDEGYYIVKVADNNGNNNFFKLIITKNK